MAEPHARYLGTSYFESLDGLRALAILPVIWHHASLTPRPGFWGKGPAGVQLFFVISGFLITTLLLRERHHTGTISLTRFFSRRSRRIFPLYYLVLTGITLQAWLALPSAQSRHFFDNWLYFATYTSNWWVEWDVPHPIYFAFAWTLAIEEQFYVLWAPALRWLQSALAPVLVMTGLLLLSQAMSWSAAAVAIRDGFWSTFCAGLSSSICLGSLLAIGLHHGRSFRWLYAVLGLRMSGLVAFAGVAVCLSFDVYHLLLHLTLCAWLATAVVRTRHALAPLLNHRWLVMVGKCSYGLYLTHFIALGAARSVIDPAQSVWVFFAALPLSIVIAQLSLRFVEEPFRRQGRGQQTALPHTTTVNAAPTAGSVRAAS